MMINENVMVQYFKEKREDSKAKWNRVLPFGEYVSDRWEKAEYLGFGSKSSVYDSSIIMGRVTVGENTWIGPYTILDGSGDELIIGNGCDISMGVQIYTHDTVKRCVSNGKCPIEKASVSIGDNCYIAPQSIIAKGVQLGKGCVVAAHSFVKDSFDDYSILAGIPAKKIGEVTFEGEEVIFVYY